MTTDLPDDNNYDPFAGIAIPETVFLAEPDLLDPPVVLTLLDGVWACLMDDDAALNTIVATIRDSELISLLADFSEWHESTLGPDPEAYAFADAAEAKAAMLEDAASSMAEYEDELSALPMAVQQRAAARLTAASVLTICLSELELMPGENQPFWSTAWTQLAIQDALNTTPPTLSPVLEVPTAVPPRPVVQQPATPVSTEPEPETPNW